MTLASSLAGWVELSLLRHSLQRRLGATGLPFSFVVKLWTAAIVGASVSWLVKITVAQQDPIFAAVLILVPYGLVYLAITYSWGVPEAQSLIRWGFRRRRVSP